MTEETSREKSLKEMYDLGFEHGYQLALKDLEIKQLEEDIEKQV